MAKYALSTYGQGSNCYIALPAQLANTAGTAWEIGGAIICHDLSAVRNYLGHSGSTQNMLRFYTDGSVAMRASANDRITAPAGSCVVDEVLAWQIKNNTTTGAWELYFNDSLVGVFPRGSAAWAVNQLCRYSTIASPFFTTLSFYAAGAASWVDSWDHTTAASEGTGWLSVSGTRSLTLVGATGAADSWWTPYDISVQTGYGTIKATAAASAELSESKTGAAAIKATAQASASMQANKRGSSSPVANATTSCSLQANKMASGSPHALVTASGTLDSTKVGAGSCIAMAQASTSMSAYKQGSARIDVTAAASAQLQASKTGYGQVMAVAVTTVTLRGHNADAAQPVQAVKVILKTTHATHLHKLNRQSRRVNFLSSHCQRFIHRQTGV